MDADLVRAKKDSIVRCIRRIESKAGLTLQQLLDDYDTQESQMGTLETCPAVGHLSKVTMSRDEREMGTLETRPTGRCRQHVAVSTMLTFGLARIAPGK